MGQLPIGQFLTTRLEEFDSTFELRSGTGFESLFFEPMQLILQPFADEATDIFTSQSFQRILLTADPDTYDTEAVDALAANLFIFRITGGFSAGSGRAYYNDPLDREYPATGATFSGPSGTLFTNPAPFSIDSATMSTQIDTNGLYYFDIPLQSTTTGTASNLDINQLSQLLNDTDVVSVTNLEPFDGGLSSETNTQLINRTQSSIGVRDLLIGNGFNAILFANFSGVIAELQPIGFGDVEMMRDITFNTHIGGMVDGYYFPSAGLQNTSQTFTGLLLDSTRQANTSINVALTGVLPSFLGNPSIDRSNGLAPIVQQIKTAFNATYTSTVSMTGNLNLATNQYVKIGINGTIQNVRVAGVNPSATNRNEIINLINFAFGSTVCVASGSSIRIQSPTSGLTSEVILDNPDPEYGSSALFIVFGLATSGAPYTFTGDGPLTFIEGVQYSIDDSAGTIQRILGATILPPKITGATVRNSTTFSDATANQFIAVQKNDIVTITIGPDAGDYRVVAVLNNNALQLDEALTTTLNGVSYSISRTGIKSEETVYVQYWFNPLSIDIGTLIDINGNGQGRGIRPGRADQTITNLAFLRITSIQIVDSITGAPIGNPLSGQGGFGRGGYGQGGFGRGQGQDYYLVVNVPEARFSMFEDSYIILNSEYQGQSFQVSYDYSPECSELHTFVRSASNRILDGDMLMKHFLPAYVSGTINYSVSGNNSTIPTAAQLTTLVMAWLNGIASGTNLAYSNLNQFIALNTDPSNQYTTYIQSYELTATIHNTDGSITVISGIDELVVPTLNPFPSYTPKPLSPRITHFIPDNIVLNQGA